MPEKAVRKMGTRLPSQSDPRHCQFRSTLCANKLKKGLGPMQMLGDLGVSREPNHEMVVDEVDVILPARSQTLDIPNVDVPELRLYREPDEILG